jgi:hypothetical protein
VVPPIVPLIFLAVVGVGALRALCSLTAAVVIWGSLAGSNAHPAMVAATEAVAISAFTPGDLDGRLFLLLLAIVLPLYLF